jgi:hypothetical protein
MSNTDTRDPEEIEREIRATQRDMSRTVDTLENQFTPRSLLNSLLDKAEENDVDARAILDGARRNPIALGLIAAGGIWLVSDSDAKPSTLTPNSDGNGDNGWHDTSEHRHHRGYVEHMSRVEPRTDEDDLTYRRRRDHARASYLMVERGHDEEESAFRKRLDQATDQMRERRDSLAQQAGAARRKAGRRGSEAAGKVQGAYHDNPLLGGLAAALVGAVAGSAVPATRTEEEQLGPMGAKAIDEAKGQARQAGEQARQKKDELVGKAESKIEAKDGSQARTPSKA